MAQAFDSNTFKANNEFNAEILNSDRDFISMVVYKSFSTW